MSYTFTKSEIWRFSHLLFCIFIYKNTLVFVCMLKHNKNYGNLREVILKPLKIRYPFFYKDNINKNMKLNIKLPVLFTSKGIIFKGILSAFWSTELLLCVVLAKS